MLDSHQIETIRETIRWFLSECNVSCKVTPFDHELYQECISEAVRRGYSLEGDHSVRTFLRQGVDYAATAGRHLSQHVNQIWLALYISCTIYVDEVFFDFPSEVPHIYLFSDRFVDGEKQGNPALNAFADLLRQTPALFRCIPSKLIVTSTLNFVTANLVEYETANMQILNTAQRYPPYLRQLTGIADGLAYMVFSREIELTEYLQAIPEIMLFITDVNDVLSFYKEELVGKNGNQIAAMAARDKETHLQSFVKLAETAVEHYKKTVKILEGSPMVCEESKRFCAGYIDFHLSSERYKLADLNL